MMFYRVSLLVMTICGMLLLSACIAPLPPTPTITDAMPTTSPTPIPTPTPVEMAPDFRLPTLVNGEIVLSDFQGTDEQGKWVLINFWATWCIPCRDEMPYLQELADRYPEQLVILGINMREEPDEIQPFLDELGVTFPILLQPDNDTLLNYGVRALPLSFMVDPAGVLQMRRVGPLQPEVLDAWLADRLAGM